MNLCYFTFFIIASYMWLAVGEKKKQTNLEASYRLHMYMATLKYLLTCHAWNTSHWICFLLHVDKVKKLAFKLVSKRNGLTHNLWRVWTNYAISAQKICKMCCIEGKLEKSIVWSSNEYVFVFLNNYADG